MESGNSLMLRDYDALHDAGPAYRLWEAGGHYSLDPLVFVRYISGRESYHPGDAVVAERNGDLIGMGFVDLGRRSESTHQASVILVLVHPDERRQGVGTTILDGLEKRLFQHGITRVDAGGWFWPGIPETPTGSVEFFANRGYQISEERFDLVIPLTGSIFSERSRRTLQVLGAEICLLSPADLSPMIEYQRREFPWWVDPLLEMLPYDMQDVVLVKRGGDVLGSAMAFTPESQTIVAGLQRQRESEWILGALGAVGVAKDWRGKGLGMALCEAAADHVRNAGATHLYVEEVENHIVPFYQKMGGAIHARSWLASKRLASAEEGP